MRIKSVRFPARFFDHTENFERVAMTEFTLGRGACGKTVEALAFKRDDIGFTITQITACNETKTFIYRWQDLEGRLEIEHV